MQFALPFEADASEPAPPTGDPAGPWSGDPPQLLVFVRHRRARRYILRLTDDGAVRVTIPRWGSKKEARAFAERERIWIEKQRRRWRDGHGRQRPDAPEQREAIARARRDLPQRLLELAASHGLTVTKVSIRNQRWRWGSCAPGGHICLNWRLALLPDALRDYVLIHELMHLKRMDHSPKFWKLVERACPDYRELRRRLRASRLV